MVANKPSILFFIGDLDVGGAERHLALLAPALGRLGYRPTIYTLTHRGKMAPELEAAGVRVIEPPFGKLIANGPSWFRRIFLLPLTALGILMEFLRRPDIVHFFLPTPYLMGGLLSLVSGIRIRLMSRRSLGVYQLGHPLMARIERWLHPKMSAVLGNSNAVIDELVEEGVPHNRLGLIYNGIDLKPFEKLNEASNKNLLRQQIGIDEDALVLVLVANLIPYKGHKDLIDALAAVQDRMAKNWLLLCVGEEKRANPTILSDLKDGAEKSGISKHLKWMGLREDVPSILAASDIGLMCSHQEGFSNSVLEAMAAGLPMIVTNVGGNPEAVLDGETGLVVPPHRPQEMGEAIIKLAGDAQLRREMSDVSRRRVQENFSLEGCLQRYNRLYKALLAGAKKPVADMIEPPE